MALEELYRDVILDHYRNPRNRGSLDAATAHATGNNPLCGDEVHLDVVVENGILTDLAVIGQGCSISQSSASMMSEAVKGRTLSEISDVMSRFNAMMDIDPDGDAGIDPDRPGAALGDLEALQGVRKFPVRIKCAALAWTTLEEALGQPVQATV
ncbi:MAG: SUF system NifU family Fe-S cluster assembly protein [Acidimicrobiia bacterium]|nr:SUF system NifU family Fe-S cluster assembly protein [Acidimicrobiia bacterium]